jgi:Flp pilus assembly protein TadG
MKRHAWNGKREKRSGAAAVEFAVVSPLLFFVMFGMFQVGRFINVGEIATTASRYGARQASVASSTVASVGTQVNSFLASTGIPASAATTKVEAETTSGSGAFSLCSNLSTVPVGAAVRVTVTINFAQVAWVPNGFFGMTLPTNIQGVTVMRKEST